MVPLRLGDGRRHLRVLCLGAHADDIEIGCGGTLLRWLGEYERVEAVWGICCAEGDRAREARRSAEALMQGAARFELVCGGLRDACLPADYAAARGFVAGLRERIDADVVLTHCLHDRHQDHRLAAELSWGAFRAHLLLEYEIPKYEGDLAQPNLFVALPQASAERKVAHLLQHFASQRSKDWFTAGTFNALMRLRGIECRARDGFAEAFHARKLCL